MGELRGDSIPGFVSVSEVFVSLEIMSFRSFTRSMESTEPSLSISALRKPSLEMLALPERYRLITDRSTELTSPSLFISPLRIVGSVEYPSAAGDAENISNDTAAERNLRMADRVNMEMPPSDIACSSSAETQRLLYICIVVHIFPFLYFHC